jgi:hypothetical protein
MPSQKLQPAKRTRPLTHKQKTYASLYAKTGNQAQSAQLAGYSPSHAASNPVPLPDINQIVISEIRSAVISVDCTVEQIMRLLWQCAAKAASEEKYKELVMLTQEINRMSGNYAPVQTVNKSINVNTTLDKLKEARKEYNEF